MEIIVIYIITLVVWLGAILFTLKVRRVRTEVERQRTLTAEDENLPALSVIVTTHDQEVELKKHLPLILGQIYPRFEVIVVDMNSSDNTRKLLEDMEADNLTLRHTFTPATGRDISRERLAITLGVKAATNEWFVLTKADCCPISHLWLRRIGEAIANHRSAEMVLGYTRYNKVVGHKARKISFERTWTALFNLGFAEQHGAYRADGTNMAYRKTLFNAHQGFASGSNLLEGATDIMVNQNSTKHNTTTCLHPDAVMEQDIPNSESFWRHHRVFSRETSRYFTRTMAYRLHYHTAVLLHMLMALGMVATIALSVMNKDYIITGIAAVAWITHFCLQGTLMNQAFSELNKRSLTFFSTAWFLHITPWWDFTTSLRHAFSNKKQYRKKYI